MTPSPKTTYFGGSRARHGKIARLEGATDFPSLVTTCFNTPVCLPYTYPEWRAMADAVTDAEEELALEKTPETVAAYKKAKDTYVQAKDVSYICACTFKEGETQRNDANADKLVLACFDIDDPDLARDFTESPQALADALFPYSFIAHVTASSTPENPKLRIIIPTEPCDPKHHRTIVRHGGNLIGLPKRWSGFRESNVLSQPFYRPVAFRDTPFTAVIASRTNGVHLELKDIPPLDDEDEEALGRTYGYLGGTDDEESLDHMPVAGLEVADIRDALFKVDPDVPYEQWTHLATALRHQFRREEEAEEAYQLFDEWSSAGNKYRGTDDTFAKWKSFKPDFGRRIPITIRTLFKVAMEAGWQNVKVATKIQKHVAEWIAECDSYETLMEEGADRIAAMPFKNAMTEEALTKALRSRIGVLGGPLLELTTIKKQVNKVRVTAKRTTDSDAENMPGWLRPWCFVTGLDKFYNTITGELVVPEAFDRAFGEQMMPTSKDAESAATGRPMVAAKDFALNIVKIKRVSGTVYDPRPHAGGDGTFFTKDGRTYVNEYRESTIPALDTSLANMKLVRMVIKDHLMQLLGGNKRHVRLMLDWMCWQVQHPGVKTRWAPCIQSGQGAGKSAIVELLGAALGNVNVKLVGPSSIKSDFNDWGTGAQVVGIEEIWVQGKTRAEVMNNLKEVTANSRISLKRKFRDTATVDNVTNFIAFTNHHNALFLEESDRRWFVLKSPLQSKAQCLALKMRDVGDGELHFDRLFRIIKDLAGAIRSFLLKREISADFNPNGDAPDTEFRRQMLEDCKNPLQRTIEELVDAGLPLVGRDIVFYPDLEDRTRREAQNNHAPSHYLYNLGYQPWENGRRVEVGAARGAIWTHADWFDEGLGCPVEMLRERLENFPDEII